MGFHALDFIVLSPAGPPEAALAIAGSRAGAIGALNLEFAQDVPAAAAELARLVRHGRGRLGASLDAADEAILDAVLDARFSSVEFLFLSGAVTDVSVATIDAAHASGRRAYVVVTSLAQALSAQKARADGLVIKGHEAGGWVGDETSFVLLQRIVPRVTLPVWVHGGVGSHSIVACSLAGATGVALESQLLLAKESPLPEAAKRRVSAMDGSETVCVGGSFNTAFRLYSRPDVPGLETIRQLEKSLLAEGRSAEVMHERWRDGIRALVNWNDPEHGVLACGQDATFARQLASRFVTVGGILAGLTESVRQHLSVPALGEALAEGAPLAQSHRTRYPIVQGPMTRVSDRAEFAEAVARAGALPFLALALMRAPEVRELLEETSRRLDGKSWGVGILGFVPAELRAEQLEVIKGYQPPFALIAGGRPDQARALDECGTQTYLHVPSPGLLEMFWRDGARRFVFEGRECGGHTGPRTSFVLWDSMVDLLVDLIGSSSSGDECHVLFAGGIHDGISAAAAVGMAAPLVARGVRVGVLAGTGYLFTREAVAAGAIVLGFQQAALACEGTALLESGPGQATRCAPSPFVDEFQEARRQLVTSGLPPEDVKNELEILNIGRLRIASKGVDRDPRFGHDAGASKLAEVDSDDQWRRGMYMIGQVAALRDSVCDVAELHEDISSAGSRLLAATSSKPIVIADPSPAPVEIAIVGMGCIMPQAPDLQTFWNNILSKVDAIAEVPATRWDWRRYYDPDRTAPDKTYSRWGGFIPDVPFDPIEYGMPPNTLASIEPFQLLALAVVRAALKDAGLEDRPFRRDRTSVVLGGGGGGDLTGGYITRTTLPGLFGASGEKLVQRLDDVLPRWTEDSFAGLLMNVTAGRIANRFDLGGTNFTVDAACASSLAAVYLGVRDLEARTSDMVVVGGVDALQNPFTFLCFSKTQAHSPTGHCRPFDVSADGIAISEGFGAVVLKRLADAERDGDRIYAVIRGVGGASDGRDRSLTAPRPEGQASALRRAYAQACFSPSTVELIEAHGTGTVAGDQAEIAALTSVFDESGAERQTCAVGSVKSMVGHTKATAGVAGLIKIALALHHRVLPATLGVTQPNPRANFPETPFYVNTDTRPWVHSTSAAPRRAGVSSFGFGGTDFHIVAEEYAGNFLPAAEAAVDPWPAELLVWRGTRAEIRTSAGSLLSDFEAGARPPLADLAFTITSDAAGKDQAQAGLAIVASSLDELIERLRTAATLIESEAPRQHTPQGIHFAEQPLAAQGKVAFLFPGQGSQYLNMAGDLAVAFDEARDVFELADQSLTAQFDRPLSRYILPVSNFTAEDERRDQAALTDTHVAQPALGVADLASLRVLLALGLTPDMVAGHSYGEFVALCAAGCFDAETLLALSEARGRFIKEGTGDDAGMMAAIDGGPDEVGQLLQGTDATLANFNTPQQTVISGPSPCIERALRVCEQAGVRARVLPVACAFHSPLMAPAKQRLSERLRTTGIQSPRITVFSNSTAAPYPDRPEQIVELLGEHLVRPVDFVRQIQAMYRSGARIFVEVGPRNTLTTLAARILGDEPHVCVAMDQPGRPGLVQLSHALAALAVEGLDINRERLYRGRSVKRLDLLKLRQYSGEPSYSATTWLVNGGHARPWQSSEPVVSPPLEVAIVDSSGATPAAPSSNGKSPNLSSPEPAVNEDGDYLAQTSPRLVLQGTVLTGKEAQSMNEQDRITAPPLSAPAATEVMMHFQQVMHRFLDTQRSVMLTYLGTPQVSTVETVSPAALPLPAARPVQERHSPPILAVSQSPPLIEPSSNGHGSVAPGVPEPNGAYISPHPSGNGTALTKVPDAAPISREELATRLTAIVSERTGYPTDMLPLDADLEADLGIDSIKRVEIAGTLVQTITLPAGSQPDMERLAASRTLRQVLENLQMVFGPQDDAHPEAAAPTPRIEEIARPFESKPAAGAIGRLILLPVLAPPATRTADIARNGTVLVVGDIFDVAEHVAAQLMALGHQCHVVADFNALRGGSGLRSPREAAEVVSDLHQRLGEIAALVCLGPAEVTPLFLLSQALEPDFLRAAEQGGAAILVATGLGGTWAVEDATDEVGAVQAGAGGYLKTLAREWLTVRMKAVDLAPAEPAGLAGLILDELFAGDGLVEVGYKGNARVRLDVSPAAFAPTGSPLLEIDEGAVLLITGGARGITAEAAITLAEQYRPSIVLVGRTPEPRELEPNETRRWLTDPDLKRALIARRRAAGEDVSLAAIESESRQLMNQREVRDNLARLRASGARIEYVSCDVCDTQAFGALIDDVYQRYGRIDGVVHGAGVIEDKLVHDKKLDSFQRVLETKAGSALTLAGKLRPESLRFLAFFSSVSGRFGNRGQADYAAASEVLNKLAQCLDRRWAARVVSINWGPWLKTGMVSAEVQRQFAERGVELIPIDIGCRKLDEELRFGSKGQAEVVIAGGSDSQMTASSGPVDQEQVDVPSLPLLAAHTTQTRDAGEFQIERLLRLDHDLYLADHVLDGRPVLPFAVAAELMAEAAVAGWPGFELVHIRQQRLFKGIVLDGPVKSLRIVAREATAENGSTSRISINVAIQVEGNTARPCYRAVVDLAERRDEPPLIEPWTCGDCVPFPVSVEQAYSSWLFHGPMFQGIQAIHELGPCGALATLRPSRPRECLRHPGAGDWLIDPVLVDSALQMQLLWARREWGLTLLPPAAQSFEPFEGLRHRSSKGPIQHQLRVRPESQPPSSHCDHYFFAADGELLLIIRDVEGTGSKALNRLATVAVAVGGRT